MATLLTPEVVAHRPVRVMFQDEARFGRMARPQRCWAPSPLRPVLRHGYEREFVYVYGAVSPLEGELDWRLCREMNTVRMGEFLTQVGQAHPREFIVMVRREFAQGQGPGHPGQYPPAAAAALCAGTDPPGTCVG